LVEEELPDDLKKAAQNAWGEASLRGHLKGEDEEANSKDKEEGGSASYVPQEKDKDTQLKYGLDLLRGIRSVDTDNNGKTEAN
jgi:carboxyl-terminal processing protease